MVESYKEEEGEEDEELEEDDLLYSKGVRWLVGVGWVCWVLAIYCMFSMCACLHQLHCTATCI